jgi:FSR family fosmidomycin resistance protein-like MFS transporter
VVAPKLQPLYTLVFPLGHFAVDTPGGALWLLAPAVGIAWGLSPAQVGLLITAYSFGAGLGYVPAGLLGDRVRRRGALLASTFWLVAFGFLAASFSPSFWVLAVLLGVGGIGSAAWHPLATGAMVERMPDRRAMALGVHLIGGVLAEVIAPIGAGFLLGYLEWSTVLRIAVIPAVVMGIAFLALARRVPLSDQGTITKTDLRLMLDAWRRPSGLAMAVMMIAYNMATIAVLAMIPLFLQERGYSTATVGVVFAVMLLSGGAVAPVLGRLSDQAGRKAIVAAAMLFTAVGSAMIALDGHWLVLITGAILAAGLTVGVRPPLLAAALEMTGRRESTALGLVYGVMEGVGALGGVLAGLLGSSDLRYAFVFAAAASLLAAVIAILHPFNQARVPATEAA